ncbi:hypothetical protein BBJ28_00026631 [Nothophytophthora sp. Chile5]|nr:hypothetical protein BBJ28_00026631 [Nothophytophthora sp. Chile5]
MLLGKQIELLERGVASEEEQLAFYGCVKKENVDAAIEASIDTVSDFADFGTHYVQEVKGPLAAQSAVSSQPLPKEDELQDGIGKLCYAGQRSQQQTELFKERLRKSIVFVDALLCKPPPGKVCSRDCRKICAQRCTEDVPCANQMCRNWHDAETHTDHCLNPQCEFKLRIVLRETRHKIDHKQLLIQKERAKVRKKKAELAAVKAGKPSEREDFMDAAEREEFTGAMQRERFVECTLLEDEIEQLERDLEGEKQELRRFSNAKKGLWATLHTIGIEEADDATDHFPDFETHYTTRKRARK